MRSRAIPKPGDSLLERYPDIAAEWHEEHNKGLGLSPDITSYLSNVIVTWECANGHIWKSRVSKRTNKGYAQCRVCESNHSGIEKLLRVAVASDASFDNVLEEETKLLFNGYETTVDITGEYRGHKFAVEYDGSRWHKSPRRVKRDIKKSHFLLNEGYHVVRIRENGLFHLDLHDDRLRQTSYRHSLEQDKILELVESIKEKLDEIHETVAIEEYAENDARELVNV